MTRRNIADKDDRPSKDEGAHEPEEKKTDEDTSEPEERETDDDTNTPDESKPANSFLPSTDLFYAFGPDRSFFIRARGKWKYYGKEQDVNSLNDLNVTYPIIAAIKHNGGWIMGSEQERGALHIISVSPSDKTSILLGEAKAYVESQEAYDKLRRWLINASDGSVATLRQSCLTIGPNGSYFARCGTSTLHHRLPSDLLEEISTNEKKGRTPAHIALGMAGAWVVLWSDGYRSWDLKSLYPRLANHAKLKDEDMENPKVVFIALDPYQAGKYFMVDPGGAMAYEATMDSSKELEYIDELTNDYMQKRAREDNWKFTPSFTKDGVTRSFIIDSSTKYDFGSGKSKDTEYNNSGIGPLNTRQILQNYPPVQRQNLFRMGAAGFSSFALSRIMGLSLPRSGVVGLVTAAGVYVGSIL